MKNKQKTWFDGLKFAESLGYREAYHYIGSQCLHALGSPFVNGMLDYIDHYRSRLGCK